MKDNRLTLTADDLALALFGCAHGSNWWRAQGRSKYCRSEKAKFDDLTKKLNNIIDLQFPQPPREDDYD